MPQAHHAEWFPTEQVPGFTPGFQPGCDQPPQLQEAEGAGWQSADSISGHSLANGSLSILLIPMDYLHRLSHDCLSQTIVSLTKLTIGLESLTFAQVRYKICQKLTCRVHLNGISKWTKGWCKWMHCWSNNMTTWWATGGRSGTTLDHNPCSLGRTPNFRGDMYLAL
jgi:hypothetical protein